MSSHIGAGLLVTVAIVVSAWPLSWLFVDDPWMGPLVVAGLLIALTGALGRRYLDPRLFPGLQVAALVGLLTAWFGDDTGLLWVIPTPDTAEVARGLIADAVHTISTSPAPAPATLGVTFVFTAGFALLAWFADVLGVTLGYRSVAAVPLLVPFLAAVANLGTPLPWYHLAALVAVLAALLYEAQTHRLRRWIGGEYEGEGAENSGRALALVAGVVALAIALATALPHASTRFLADGLGRGDIGRVGFSPSPDMITDLLDEDRTPVLVYRTDDPAPPPIRVSVAHEYRNGTWQRDDPPIPLHDEPSVYEPHGLHPSVERTRRTFDVERTRLDPPYLAVPAPVAGGTVYGALWGMDPRTGVVEVDRRPSAYTLGYLVLPEADRHGRRPVDVQRLVEGDEIHGEDMDTSAVTPLLRETLDEVVRGADSPLVQAQSLQTWFREDPSFSYSLQLPPPPEGWSAELAAQNAVDLFLQHRQGYCVQYATTMVLMARELGIPARLATGFLPGASQGTSRVVRASDAHAWPELYLENLGWTRFEPTPGTRAASVPPYAPDPTLAPGEPTLGPTTPTPTVAPAPAAEEDPAPTEPAQQTGSPTVGPFFLLLALLLLAVAASPLLALARHHRALAGATPSEAIDEHWRRLRRRLDDLGIDAPTSATVRARAAAYRARLSGDEQVEAALDRLVAAVEAARYAPSQHGPTSADVDRVAADAATVWASARAWVDGGRRLRALLLPSDGRPRRPVN